MPNLSAIESRLTARIAQRRDDLLADLRRHVNLPTGPGGMGLDESRALFTQRLEQLGARTTLRPGDPRPDWISPDASSATPPATAVCTRVTNSTLPKILLAGHLDTVHPATSPFRELVVTTDGKRATGPGCMDMKGGIVIAVAALEALEEIGLPCSWSFLLNADEETGSYCSDRTLRDEAAKHDLGLAFEPAMPDGGLVVARPGSGQFMLEVRGKAAHVGRDFTSGISAVNALAERLLRIANMPRPDQGLIVSVGPIDGGTASNIVPDRARAWGNVRFPDQAAADRVLHELGSLATPPTQSTLPTVQLRTSFSRPPKPKTPHVERLALLARQAAQDLGQHLPFGTTGGVCDGNNLQAAGLPTIDTLGVRGGGAHTTDEWIDLTSLVERCQLVAVLLSRLAQGAMA